MAGTVRGTFDLNSRPASTALRQARTEGERTRQTMVRVGQAMDKIGTPRQVRRLDIYKRKLEQVERAGKRSFRTLRKEWTATDRQVVKSVETQTTAIDHLQTKLEELAVMKASPEIDVDGVTEALAQVELLHKRLKALGRERVVPRIGIGATTARAATAAATTGASRGGEGLLRSMNVGPFNLGQRGFPIIAAAGLPAATSLGGATVGLAGSLGAGALGAGALGIAGGGILTTAIASIASVAVPTAGKLEEASKALESFQEEVRESGSNSVEAREKWREFNRVIGQSPRGTRNLLASRERLTKRFGRMTRPAQGDLMGIMTDPVQAANALTPQFSGVTNRFFGKANKASDRFFGEFATGDRSRRFIAGAGAEAAMSLDEVEAITEHVLGSLMNITVASRPFFREALNFLEEWTGGWLESTDNIGQTRKEVGTMIGHLRTWLRLGDAAFDLLRDLAVAGSPSGKGLVSDLTSQLEEWDRWVQRNPRQVRSFFRDTTESTKKLAGALGKIAESLFEISQMLTPLLDQFSGLVKFLGDAGLLTPGGLPLLIAGGAGVRNASRGFGARVRGGAAGAGMTGVPLILGGGTSGGAGRGGGRYFRDTYGLARGFGRGRAASTVAGLGAAAMGPRPAAFARGFAGRFGPLAAISGGLTAISTKGNLGERLQAGTSGATLGLIPMPETEQEKFAEGFQRAQDAHRRLVRGGLGAGAEGLPTKGLPGVGKTSRGLRIQALALAQGIKQHRGATDPEDEGVLAFNKRELEAVYAQMRSAGSRASGDFYKAFLTRTKDRGPEEAMKATIDPVLKKIGELGPRGGRVFAQSTIRWAREAKRKNPELADEYDELTNGIERRFRRMGQNIRIIHGRIYTDSKGSWERIKDIISTQSWAAEQESREAFGAMEREVFRRLKAFGFSAGQARDLIQTGGDVAGAAKMGAGMATVGKGRVDPHFLGNRGAGGGRSNAKGGRNRFAGGGRFAGRGKEDTVGLPGGGLAAPGEFWIGNRHTERRIDHLLAPYGTSLGREIEGEKMKHSSTPLAGSAFAASLGRRFSGFARGGRFARGGHSYPDAMGALPGLDALAWILKQRFGLSVVSGMRPGAITTTGNPSDHGWGGAIDVSNGVTTPQMDAAHAWLERSLGPALKQMLYRTMVGGNHYDHIHVALNEMYARNPGALMAVLQGKVGARGFAGMGGAGMAGAGGIPALKLKDRKTRQGGAAGALAQRGMDMVKAGMEASVNRKLGVGARGSARMTPRNLRRYNRSYPEHRLGEPGAKLPGGVIEAIAESAGLPPRLFRQISIGESGDYPGIVGIDPGGTEGLGLWMITTGYNDALIRRLGGRNAMLNPVINARAAKEIYDSQGSGAWYGTSHVTKAGWSEDKNSRGGRFSRGGRHFARGGRRPARWAGSFRDGGDFITRPGRPVAFEAGEGLEQERISISPRKRPGGVAGSRGGGGGGGDHVIKVELKIGTLQVRSERDLEEIKKHVAAALLEALQKTDSVKEKEVLG